MTSAADRRADVPPRVGPSLRSAVPLEALRSAARGLEGVAVQTPLLDMPALAGRLGFPVAAKCEHLQTIGAFKIMEPVLVQTAGGPDYATHTIGLEIWYNAFMFLKFGYATAAAWMMGLVLVTLTVYQLKVLQNVRYSTAGI